MRALILALALLGQSPETIGMNYLRRSGGTMTGSLRLRACTIAADDTTPSVAGCNILVTSANSIPTAITDLDNPIAGQVIYLCGGSNTNSSTIADSGNFNLDGQVTLSLDTCVTLYVQADNDYVELSSNAVGANVQSFTAGAGTYTWTKPHGASIVSVVVIGAGGGGGSGGYSAANDSGGGAGASGATAMSTFAAADLTSTVTVTLAAGGAGGATKSSAGNGNDGSGTIGATSFGAYVVVDPPTTAYQGSGGDATQGVGGTAVALGSYTTFTGTHGIVGSAGGAGDDAGSGSGAATVAPSTLALFYYYLAPTGGGGGGGTNGGANFTAGGGGGKQNNGAAVQIVAGGTNGSSNGAAGGLGVDGGYRAGTGTLLFAGGTGGGGGAGGEGGVVNGGAGRNGGNCGGGGGGGGSSESGSTGSGVGGDGGAGCVFVISW